MKALSLKNNCSKKDKSHDSFFGFGCSGLADKTFGEFSLCRNKTADGTRVQ